MKDTPMDVSKAAERLRRHMADPKHRDTYHGTTESLVGDWATLARAYLAEHPADDSEPLTEEWLRSVGFDADEDQAELRLPDFCHPDWPEDPIMTMLVINKDGLCCLSQGPDESANWPRLITTRGDLRRLTRALGIELKGE